MEIVWAKAYAVSNSEVLAYFLSESVSWRASALFVYLDYISNVRSCQLFYDRFFFRIISVFCDVSITQIFDTVNTFFGNKFTFS